MSTFADAEKANLKKAVEVLQDAGKGDPAFGAALTRLARTRADYEIAAEKVADKIHSLGLQSWLPNKGLEDPEEIAWNISGTEEFQNTFGAGRKVGA
jgi:hypothetical protein